MRCLSLAAAILLGPVSGYSQVDFARDVQPVFASRCYVCHGPKQHMAGLRLDDAASATAAADKIIERVSSTKKGFAMPAAGPPLTPKQIATIRTWAEAAAKMPKTAQTISRHWSFQPCRRPELPDVSNRAWVRTPIDRFVLARLEREGIRPSPEAGRDTLIRRLSLDLTGLPPTPSEIADFVNDNRPDAYERLVDRLIASPHYGEKWARTWLDLAHYADSDGYEKDLSRPWAWRYRQWVIEALNADMPFDEFTIEQIAGDLLPGATVDQRIGTGFLRNTLTNREAGVDRMEARFEQIINRTNTVGTVWLGLTVGCAQCHNHKFDPIPQKDYYRMFAFFNTAEEQDIDAPLPGELGPYLRAKPEYDRKRRELLEQYGVAELQKEWEARLTDAFRNQGKDLEWDFQVTEFRAGFDGAEKFLRGYWDHRTQRQAGHLTDYFLDHRGPDIEKNKDVSDRLRAAREKLLELHKMLPAITQAPVMRHDPVPVETNIHLGGDYQALGDKVEAGTLSVLGPPPAGKMDRLALAKWIVSRDNPLTARVAVNRMWQEFFGRGLVRTSEDFGTQGEKPSHPELLDWLACEFQERGWSMKQMHKLIVMSAVYRQSSHVRKDIEARDPENTLLARQSRVRLPAELIRDEALAVSGLLNDAIGGRSVRPPQPAGIAELGYANKVKWVESTGPDRYRRGMYIHFQRTTPYPMLMNFDEPDSNTTCTRRRRSNTPLQSLNLLNDPVFFEAAQALALRVIKDAPASPEDRVEYAFELCMGRKPEAREKQTLLAYYGKQKTILDKENHTAPEMQPFQLEGVDPVDNAAWVGVSRVLLNTDEFITRE